MSSWSMLRVRVPCLKSRMKHGFDSKNKAWAAHLPLELAAGLAQGQDVQQSGLAGPARPKQSHAFTRVGIA